MGPGSWRGAQEQGCCSFTRADFQCAFFLSASALLRGVSLLSHPHLHSVLTPMRPMSWEEREEGEKEEEEEEEKRGM